MSANFLIDVIAEPNNKKTLLATREFLHVVENIRYRHGKPSIDILNQKLPEIFHFLPLIHFSKSLTMKSRNSLKLD